MVIDEDKDYILPRYVHRKGSIEVKETDHFTLILDLCVEYKKKKPPRVNIYNFKNDENIIVFLKTI